MSDEQPSPAPQDAIGGPDRPARRSLGDVRFLALVAVVGLCASTITTFWIAIGKTVRLVDKAISNGTGDELLIVSVLEAVDTHLLGVVQLIVAIGLYELFVGDLRVPDWLEARSLEDLKKPIVDVLVVFVAIKGIERFVVEDEPLDALAAVGAAAVLIASLTLFRTLTATRKRSG